MRGLPCGLGGPCPTWVPERHRGHTDELTMPPNTLVPAGIVPNRQEFPRANRSLSEEFLDAALRIPRIWPRQVCVAMHVRHVSRLGRADIGQDGMLEARARESPLPPAPIVSPAMHEPKVIGTTTFVGCVPMVMRDELQLSRRRDGVSFGQEVLLSGTVRHKAQQSLRNGRESLGNNASCCALSRSNQHNSLLSALIRQRSCVCFVHVTSGQ